MKIVYIGTFNPLTVGHLLIAEKVYNMTKAEIVFVPVSDGYQKEELLTPFRLRQEMIEAAINDNDHFMTSDIEDLFYQKKGRQPYTVETLEQLTNKYQDEIGLLIGSDNFSDLDGWYQPEEIMEKHVVYVFPRYNQSQRYPRLYERYRNRFIILEQELVTSISASMVRRNFREGLSNKYLLSQEVIDYINDREELFNTYFKER